MQVVIQRIQEYFDHVLLQLVDVIGVLLQGVADCCLEVDGLLAKDDDGADDNGNEVMLMMFMIIVGDNTFKRLP